MTRLKDLGHSGLAVNSDALWAGSFPPDVKMENRSGTNILEHKSRVTVQHLFIAAAAARGGNLTNKNYQKSHVGLVTAQGPFCEKEFIGLFYIITHVGEL